MIRITATCPACPEQYSVHIDDDPDEAAYVRLRHGHFTLDIPFGNTVFERSFYGGSDTFDSPQEPEEIGLPDHDSDGMFFDATVREAYLRLVARLVAEHRGLPEDAEFVVETWPEEDLDVTDPAEWPWVKRPVSSTGEDMS